MHVFHKLAGFVDVGSNLRNLLVTFEVDQLSIDESVVDVFVTQDPHYVKGILGLVVFHGSFEMSERVEGYLLDSRVVQFCGHFLALTCPLKHLNV